MTSKVLCLSIETVGSTTTYRFQSPNQTGDAPVVKLSVTSSALEFQPHWMKGGTYQMDLAEG